MEDNIRTTEQIRRRSGNGTGNDMKNGKTDGNDDIITELIKYADRKTCQALANIYMKKILSSYFDISAYSLLLSSSLAVVFLYIYKLLSTL